MGLRKERLADELRDIIGSLFQGGRMDDPRLAEVTISAVKLSPDLQVATVYFRVYPGANPDAARVGLGRAAGFIRKELAGNLELRRVPELRFFYDESIERGSRVEELLQQINAH